MFTITRRTVLVTSLLAATAGGVAARAQAPKLVSGRPYQFWDVLEADGAARKVYFRNDGAVPITITEIVIQRCDNTRQLCGTYPANVVIPPGKTVVAFKAEQLDRKLGWYFSYSFHTRGEPQVVAVTGMPAGAIIRAPDGGPAAVLQTVAIDSLMPAVPASTEGASCGMVTVPDLPAGHRALLMVFGTASQPTARRVMVRLDANGSAYDFSDIRRDPDDTGPDPRQTQITLDLVRQTAMLRNSGGGQPATFFRATGSTLLTATPLGKPGETIARMVQECGAGH
jgi:hypothetical protein